MSKSVKRKVLSPNDKHDVLLDIAAGVERKEILVKYGIHKSTLSVLLKKKDEIESAFQTHSGVSFSLLHAPKLKVNC